MKGKKTEKQQLEKQNKATESAEIPKTLEQNIPEQNTQETIAKYTIKDSVFTHLFQDKKYLLQLYQALHPEDTKTTEDALVDITIKNILTDEMYNDLGFRVGDTVMILVEAQSTWTMNIIVRMLLYLAQTYRDYFDRCDANLYGSKKVRLPRPELYVIYSGQRTKKPDTISLSNEFFGGRETAVEVKVKMIYGENGNDIISQYVTFTKVYNEQLILYGRTRKAIMETIRICKDRDVLKEYLKRQEKEVVTIMMSLFDDEYIMRTYIAEKTRDAAKETARKMLKSGKLSIEEIPTFFPDLSADDIREIEAELQQLV